MTLIFWILIIAAQSLSLKINLALNKKAYLSSVFESSYARYAVDGNVNRDSYAHANNGRYFNKDEDGWFVVDLGRPYQVEYVIFYHRYCTGCEDSFRMDNFIVGLSNNFDPSINKTINRDYKRCAKYNGSLDPGARVEIQCQDKESYSRYVIVQQDVGKEYLAIPEIEVYGEYVNYVGCFKTLINFTNHGSNTSLVRCMNTCESLNYLYAALQISTCSCGNDMKNFSPLSECNVKCPGDVDFCGSSHRFSVYEVFPLKFLNDTKRKYIGCFVDNNDNRDLTHNNQDKNGMTEDKCQNYCAKRNYLFFGLQYAYECFCGIHYGLHGMVSDSQCNLRCTGNNSQICGSAGRNSIYSLSTERGGSIYFKNNHHCEDNMQLDLDGVCTNRQCKDGWSGDDCSIRNCSINKGDCGIHECQLSNVNGGIYSECICNDGYDKNYWWDYCHDIDECNENMCNLSVSYCTNTEGNYVCNCLKGFQSQDKNICIDIDECKAFTRTCNATNTDCSNTFGSYFCTCKDGFKNESKSPYNCTDVDECLERPNSCNSTISNCTNTLGSYKCDCFHGYVNDKNSLNLCLKAENLSDQSKTSVIIIAVVCSILGIIIILGIAIVVKYRGKIKRRLERFGDEKPVLVAGEAHKTYARVHLSSSRGVALSELRNHYEHDRAELVAAFEKIPKVSQDSTECGQRVKLRSKNKFKNILPFDKNRVALRSLQNDSTSDYINASFISDAQGNVRFIASQGPTKESENDFWRMIVEKRVEIIVMLTNCIEDGKVKCIQYWPEEGSYVVDDIGIRVEETKVWSTHEIRKLVVTKEEESRTVHHLLYKLWFDHKAPENVGSLLNFHHSMKQLERRDGKEGGGPILVHCSAGVGRTGTFIAIDHLLHEAQRTQEVDVLKCVQCLRSQRNYMIQTKIQFMFCFNALIFYHELGSTTAIKIIDGSNVLQTLSGRKNLVDKEYEIISSALSSKDVGKIKNNGKLKFCLPGCVQNSEYKISIGGSISWKSVIELCKDETQTITILIDKDINEKSKMLPYSDQIGRLTLTERFSDLPVWHIECMPSDLYGHVYNNTENQVILAMASDTFHELRALWTAVKEFQSKRKSLIIHMDDLREAGFVACALNLLEMMAAVGEIDLFQVVYQLRKEAPEILQSLDTYRHLHLFVESCFGVQEHLYVNSVTD